jgi:hypothetical protein
MAAVLAAHPLLMAARAAREIPVRAVSEAVAAHKTTAALAAVDIRAAAAVG